ncbi:MAG: PAS domain S-box protein [Salinivirgaceae bacterium]|nr:PAS domain S-box protein [Salinivirgaceae bacterium]
MKIHLYYITIIFTIIFFFSKFGYSQSVNTETSKVLILHSLKEKRPWNLMYNMCFRDAAKNNKNLDVDIFIENLDLLEHNDEEYKDIVKKMLQIKYKNDFPDILVITQPTAVKFIYDRNLFSNIPKILILPSKQGFEGYPKSTIITYAANFEAQFSHALKVFPETKEAYIVAGNSKIDKSTLAKFTSTAGKFNKQILFKYLTNLDRDSILNYVKYLPNNSFVYYLSYTQDLNGKAYMAKDFSFDLAEHCNRPVFCYLDLLTENTGILGGMVVSLKSIAIKTAEFIEQNLEGTIIDSIPPAASNYSFTYDWNELKKWNIDMGKLPSESVFYNRKYSIVELYKKEVIFGFILLIISVLLIIVLLTSNRNRRRNEKKLKKQNDEYAALNEEYITQNEELIQTNQELYSANERVEESINRLHTLINTIPDLVWLKDINGIYLECNNRFESFFGSERKDIVGKTDYDFVSKDLADFFKLHDKAAMNAGKSTTNEEQIAFASDGHKEYLETIKTPLHDIDGNVVGVLGIGRNISERIRYEKDLLEAKENAVASEQYLENIINNIGDPVFVKNDKSQLLLVNDAFCTIFLLSKEQVIGKTLAEDVTEEEREQFLKIDNLVLLTGKEHIIEESLTVRGGEKRTISTRKSRYIDAHGQKFLIGIIRDITDRKQSEEELINAKEKAEESEVRFRAFTEQSPISIYITNIEGDCVYANDKWLEIAGMKLDEALGKGWANAIHPDDHEQIRKGWYKSVKSNGKWSYEYRFKNKDGIITWVEGTAKKLLNEKNELLGYLGTNVNIDESKRAKSELIKAKEKAEESERKLAESLIDLELAHKIAEIGNWHLNPEIGILQWSDEIYNIYERDRKLGPPHIDEYKKMYSPEQYEVFSNAIGLAITKGEKYDIVLKYTSPSKKEKWIRAICSPDSLKKSDKGYFLRSTIQDITKLKEVEAELIKAKERAEESDSLKTGFLTNMSHEIRTPLNAVLGFSQLLLKNNLSDAEKKKFSEYIRINGEGLAKIIDDIIDISKLQSNQLLIKNTDFNLHLLISELDNYYRNILIQKSKSHLKFNLQIPNVLEKDFFINSDQQRLKQVLNNLISNAVKYTAKGQITFGCEIFEDMLLFFVEDTGYGISEKNLTQIFERFAQFSPQYVSKQEGTGLVLSISKNLVTLLGGELKVESKINEGSKFYFQIPLTKAKNKPIETKKLRISPKTDLSKCTILIADDEESNYALTKRLLKHTKVTTEWAQNGLQAVEMAINNNYDLILMDIKMPEMDGIEASILIKKKKNVPIIIQTAFAIPEVQDKAMKAGCDGFIVKPISIEIFLDLVNKYLN